MSTDSFNSLFGAEFTARFGDVDDALWLSCQDACCPAPQFATNYCAAERDGSGLLSGTQWSMLDAKLQETNLDPVELMLWAYLEFWPRVAPGSRKGKSR